MVPYMASAGWYAEWLRGISIGMPEDEAAGLANCVAGIEGKDFTRCRIRGSAGGLLLSIPVEGGAARLKRRAEIPHLRISEHGNWRHTHIGALNAAYGRAPYFQHFMPLLETAYHSNEQTLKGFNAMIHEAFLKMLFGEENPENVVASIQGSRIVEARGKEMATEISFSLSIIDSLMRFGRDTLLALSLPCKYSISLNPKR